MSIDSQIRLDSIDSAIALPFATTGSLLSARRAIDRFLDTADSPGDPGGDATGIGRTCLELVAGLLEDLEPPERSRALHAAVARWTGAGVPLHTIHNALNAGFEIVLDLLPTDTDHIAVGAARLMLEVLDRVTTAVSVAYVRESATTAREHRSAVDTLTLALLGGRSTATVAREGGIEVAGSYHVLALSFPGLSRFHEIDPLRTLRAELAARFEERALSILRIDGGMVLIPAHDLADTRVGALIDHLTHVCGHPLTATHTTARPHQLPAAVDQAQDLLDIVLRLGLEPGVYRLDELALEYQLTRPGPGRDQLGSLLDELDEYPDLLATLRTHIATDLNRQRTARLLHVHANTVDYRLKRIDQLTGFDITRASGLWHLRSALIARAYRR